MKTLLGTALLMMVVWAAPLHADPQSDADYIVSQTVTKEIFEGALSAQRPLIIGAMENNLRAQNITLTDPERFFDLVMSEFIDEFTDAMQEQSADIYLRNFSADDLAEIAAFMKTDAGQAFTQATPVLMMEGARLGQIAGQRAGQNAGRRVADVIEAEGLIVVEDASVLDRLLDTLR